MNKKYLFGMLLSGAMLAACTADDDLNTARVKQDVNPSAPVFTVSFGGYDLQNRAEYGNDGHVHFKPSDKDKLSLFHGMTKPSTISSAIDLKGWQNAIYTGATDDAANAVVYTTPSVVNPGLALMVYPGDTDFTNELDGNLGKAAPNITISLNQNEKTKELTPYMSEFLQLKANPSSSDKDWAAAGYDKPYDIALKKVGSQLILNLVLEPFTEIDIENLGVKALTVQKVALVNNEQGTTTAGKGLFTKSIPVAVKLNDSKNAVVEPVAKNIYTGEHLTWYAQSHLDFANAVGEDEVITSDVTYTKTNEVQAIFTLLPFKGTEASGAVTWDGFQTNATSGQGKAENMAIVLYTNYGNIVVGGKDNATAKVWMGRELTDDRSQAKSVLDGIKDIADYFWYDQQSEGTFLVNGQAEKVGSRVTRYVDVATNNRVLRMEGLHVQNEQELIDALKVYEELSTRATSTDVEFFLDGDKNGEFKMTKATWEKVIAMNTRALGKVTCTPCKDKENGKQCSVIVLENTADEAEEVPALRLGQSTDNSGNSDLGKLAGIANVKLVGAWKYTDQTVYSSGKTFENVNKLIVTDTLTLANEIKVSGNVLPNGIEISATGGVGVKEDANVFVPVTNFGYMNIEGHLTMSGKKGILENREAQGSKATGWSDGAVIDVYGTLGIETSTAAIIGNYGIINQKKANASIHITKNAATYSNNVESGGNIDMLFNNGSNVSENKVTNRIGTIYLYEATPKYTNNVSIDNIDNKKGFVKVVVDKVTPEKADFGTFANYVIVKGSTEIIKVGDEKDAQGNVVKSYMPSNIEYIEVDVDNAEDNILRMEGDFTFPTSGAAGSGSNKLKALLVREGSTVEVLPNSFVSVQYAYVHENNTWINYSGTFKYDIKVGYFGGETTDTGIVSKN